MWTRAARLEALLAGLPPQKGESDAHDEHHRAVNCRGKVRVLVSGRVAAKERRRKRRE